MPVRLLYLLIFLFTSSKLCSQPFDEKDFVRYGLKQGLSDNYVSGIIQDSNGYIWVGTRYGLNRFDGNTFKQFLVNSRHNSIPDNSIYSMKALTNNRFTIATDDGAQVISTKTLEQITLSIADDDKLRYWSNSCFWVLNDADGNYGVSTKTGFYIFNANGQLKKRYDFYTRADIGEWMLFGDELFTMPDGNIMQLNKNGALLYNRKKNQFTDPRLTYPGLKNLVSKKFNNVFFALSSYEYLHLNVKGNSFDIVDIRSGLIASFPYGVELLSEIDWTTKMAKINDSTWALNCKKSGFYLITVDEQRKTLIRSPKYFTGKFCTNIFKDREGKLWIGTNEGLYQQRSHPAFVETFKLNAETFSTNISALHVSDDKIFIGTNEKAVLILDKQSKRLLRKIQFPASPVLSNNIRTFHSLNSDTLWVGASAGFYWIHLRNYSTGSIILDSGKAYQTVYLFFADSKKRIWISNGELSTLYYYDQKTGTFTIVNDKNNPLFKTNVTSVTEDKNGNIWIGGDAIVRWNSISQKIDTCIERLPTQKNFKKGYYVMTDSKADVWTTVNDDGFVKLTGSTQHLRPQNLTQEKSSFMHPALLNDKIFVFTTKGAGHFDIRSLKSIAFTEKDGIPPGPTSTSYFVQDKQDGSVWFGIKDVLCRFPSSSAVNYGKPPALNITALSIINDTLINYPSKKILLNHRQSDLHVFYGAVNYSDPENMQFAYRIKNKKDSSWIEAGEQQTILLTNLSPGTYNVEIKVSAFDNKWVEQIEKLEIEITPPFWQTPLFLISILILFFATSYYLYKKRIKQIKLRANIDKQLTQTEMRALHAQMNPHFIFNCLNSIREMILNNENEQASLYLSKFARLIRISLNHSAKQFVSLTDTVDYLERYIEMERIRSAHFSYTFDVAKVLNTDDIMVPPMLIQPFIENAIWHGMSQKKNMALHISFRQQENQLICTVEDDGIGIEESLKRKKDSTHEPSVGIDNIKKRIALLNEKYKLQSKLQIQDKLTLSAANGSGTIVTLHLPIKINESLWT